MRSAGKALPESKYAVTFADTNRANAGRCFNIENIPMQLFTALNYYVIQINAHLTYDSSAILTLQTLNPNIINKTNFQTL